MELPILGEGSYPRRRYEVLGAWHGLSIPRANKREAWGRRARGGGLKKHQSLPSATENTALGQGGRRGREAQGQGVNTAS